MASVREHLAAFHKSAATHEIELGKAHQELADCFTSMSKAAGMDPMVKLAAGHAAISEQHANRAAEHIAACKDCEKSASDDLDKIVPDNIRGIIPSDAPPIQKVTAVPRFGAPQVDATNVPLEFAHLVKLEE